MKSNEIKSNRWLWAALLLAAILIILRSPVFLQPILDVDESIYALFARSWFDGGIPYLDCVETKPLGIYFFYGLIFSIFGKFNMAAVHALTIVVVGATAYVIGKISNELYSSKRAGFLAAFLYIIFGTTYIPKYIATTIEPIMLLPVALQFYWWLRYERTSSSYFALLSGFAFSASCLFKYQAGINLFVLLGYLLIAKPLLIKKLPSKSDLLGLVLVFVGAIPLPVIMLAYLAYVRGLEAFWIWNMGGSLEYVLEGAASIPLARQLLVRVLPYVLSTGLIWVLAVARTTTLLRSSFQKRVEGSEIDVREFLILIWFVLTIIPVSVGHRFYGHYFYLLLPPMAVLGSRVFDHCWSGATHRWIKRLMIIFIIAPAIGFFAARFFMTSIHKAVHEDNLSAYHRVAGYVSSHTQPTDRIIAWGYAPLVYWYSERLPATRFFWSDLLTGRVPGTKHANYDANKFVDPKAWDMFMDDLNRHTPVYVIDMTPTGLHDYEDYPIGRYPRLLEYLQKNYHEETVIDGAVLYKRN